MCSSDLPDHSTIIKNLKNILKENKFKYDLVKNNELLTLSGLNYARVKEKKIHFQILALNNFTYDAFETQKSVSFIYSRLTVMTLIDIICCHMPKNPYTGPTWKCIFNANTKMKKYKIVIGYERF